MKKYLVVFALALAVLGVKPALAGAPLQANLKGSYYNTLISTSVAPASGVNAQSQLSAVTRNGVNCRYCINHIDAQLSSSTTFYVIDGTLATGTTVQTVYGANVASGHYVDQRPALEPWCLTSGNSFSLRMPSPASATGTNTFEADGFTFCGSFYNNGTGPN